MIPRILHHVWVGPRPVPDHWAAAWAAMHPGWEQRIWREADLDTLDIPRREVFDAYMRDRTWHGASDLARIAILEAVGGVYVDIDSRPLRSLEGAPFMADSFFAAYEPPNPHLPGRVANGTIGSEPGHPVLASYRRIVEALQGLEQWHEPWNTVGGTSLTAAMAENGVQPLPARTFYQRTWKGEPVRGNELAYADHFWATTNHSYPIQAVVLVPRRAGDPIRDANWEWCKRIWQQQGWPIFEGHHDEPGLFNASKARNAAAAAAGDWDVAIFADADTVPWDWRPVREAVPLAAKSGRFIRPFSSYYMLDEEAAKTFMATGARPSRGSRRLGESAYGGIHVVPRRLWDASGGYDERFLGWGSEDAAFQFACTVLGGFTRLAGDVYHLWHPMQQRDPSTPQFQANVALGARYRAATTKARVRSLLAERTGGPPVPPSVGALIMTNGRREYIERTVASLEAQVGPFSDRVICDDSGDPAFVAWLTERFPEWRVMGHRHLGHGPAVRFAIMAARKLDADWVWWSEDDIEYVRPVDVPAMVAVLEGDPDLKQLVLRRQAWFPSEVAAGGMIERFDPSAFTEHDGASPWLEHRLFYSLQPHLVSRALLEVMNWPPVPNSEHHFSQRLFRNKAAHSGLWGARDDAPWVEHIGLERVGSGY